MTGTLNAVAHKAQRLHEQGFVTEVPQRRVFRVTGDHGAYTVTLSHDGMFSSCTCPATVTCSHVGAAMLAAGFVGGDDA